MAKKQSKAKDKKKPQAHGQKCKCLHCGHVWVYSGNQKPEGYVQCAKCRFNYPLRKMTAAAKGESIVKLRNQRTVRQKVSGKKPTTRKGKGVKDA